LTLIGLGAPQFAQSCLWLAVTTVILIQWRFFTRFGDFLFIIDLKNAAKLLYAFIKVIIFG
jgi:hypothetical protein